MSRSAVAATAMLLLMLVASGCQSTGSAPTPQMYAVPIASFQSVAGKWAGLIVRAPRSREDDWVRVAIAEDGQYEFASYRTIGVLSGRGQFTLGDGKLTVTTERGTATGSLWASERHRMLRFTGALQDGTQYTAELTPSKK